MVTKETCYENLFTMVKHFLTLMTNAWKNLCMVHMYYKYLYNIQLTRQKSHTTLKNFAYYCTNCYVLGATYYGGHKRSYPIRR